MRSLWLWIILMILWILLGMWLCRKYLCNTLPAAVPVTAVTDKCSSWTISDINNLNLELDNNVSFLRSASSRINVNTNLTNAMGHVSNHLRKNSNRKLLVTGYYSSTETNSNTSASNLGVARAQNIKSWLTTLGAPANQIMTSSRLGNNCFNKDTLRRGIEFDFSAL